jgi:hypothetical protein
MENIDVCKRAIKDYKDIKLIINTLVEKGANFDFFKNFINELENANTTNVDDDFEYIDFNYRDMTLTISNKCGLYLADDIELWNDETGEYIGQYNNIGELENYVKDLELKHRLTEKMYDFSNELNDDELDFAIKELQFWKKEREKQQN